jgi:sterol desaturase/sphingolipid hydroxylase (fatty acid hydroxylase superfamily)
MGTNLGSIAAFIFYGICFTVIGAHEVFILNRLGYIYGYFDGKRHVRDSVARIGGARAIAALLLASTLRPMLIVWLRYDHRTSPASMSWMWLPVEIGLYALVLDFWFYCYHRIMHETSLWAYHKTHHFAKHPCTLLSLHTGIMEWIYETAGLPTATLLSLKCMGLPMGFYEFWVCELYVLWFELGAHSGIRINASPPTPLFWLLKLFNVDNSIEDHDLHHRAGWKLSYNYGKQSRLWDRLFGTSRARIESVPDNIDYSNPASFPLF